jgi:hypothetical protein
MLTEGARKVYRGRRVGQGWSKRTFLCPFQSCSHSVNTRQLRDIGRRAI